MPILGVEVVGHQSADVPTAGLADRIAGDVGTALAVPARQVWVSVRSSVHVIFEPDASGRVFFGGAPDLRAR